VYFFTVGFHDATLEYILLILILNPLVLGGKYPPYYYPQMDFLDPKKQFKDRLQLWLGYILIASAIVVGARVLVYKAYCYNVAPNGSIIQCGLVFFSSQPNPANIYVNGKPRPERTNTSLTLPGGIYQVTLARSGYRDWKRTIAVNEGNVEHFDYPLLIPKTLVTKNVQGFDGAPGLMSQSNDRRWVLIEKPGSSTDFDLYDLKNSKLPVETTISLPTTILSPATGPSSFTAVDWADDNQHLLLQRSFDGKSEYIMLDRANPDQSINLTTKLNLPAGVLSLNNKKYDQYYLFANNSLQSLSLKDPTLTTLLQHVLAFKSYGSDTILYVTADNAPAGKVLVSMSVSGTIYNIRSIPLSSQYLLDLTSYSGTLYVAAGASSAGKVYVYPDPVAQITSSSKTIPVPSWVLQLPNPNYLNFSVNAQFVLAENADQYAVYDIQNQLGYNYSDPAQPIDKGQSNATWMDGDRLVYTSQNELTIQDYDNTNQQPLVPSLGQYLSAFTPDFRYVFTMTNAKTAGHYELTSTPLLTPPDLP
jgi:hypothetical protein